MLPPAPLGRYAVLGNHDYAVYSYSELFRNMARSVKQAATPEHKLVTLAAEMGTLGQLALDIYRNDRLLFAGVPNNTDELIRLLTLYDVTVLHNRSAPLPVTPEIWVAGVDDMVEGQPDLTKAMSGIPHEAGVILLTHNPDLAYEQAAQRANLVFAGHTHGGQVALPGLGAIHTQGTRLPRQHAAGYFNDLPGGGQMIVSRGMGESTPLRFSVPPEIVWVEIR
jgi:predicted MPP superfamily phosphohydrolase